MDLLTICIHHWELQAITTPSLISTLYKSPHHLLNLFPACCVFHSRSLAAASNSGDSSASPHPHRYSPANIPQLNCSADCLQDNSSARTMQKTQLLYRCRGVFAAPLHINGRGADYIQNAALLLLRSLTSNGRCLRSHFLATGLYVTLCQLFSL
jgi:hypothetical protein